MRTDGCAGTGSFCQARARSAFGRVTGPILSSELANQTALGIGDKVGLESSLSPRPSAFLLTVTAACSLATSFAVSNASRTSGRLAIDRTFASSCWYGPVPVLDPSRNPMPRPMRNASFFTPSALSSVSICVLPDAG